MQKTESLEQTLSYPAQRGISSTFYKINARITLDRGLAIRCEDLVRRGEITDYADAARLGHVTRARMSQIMNLLNLAPDIQEAILFLPRTTQGRDTIGERDLRSVCILTDWKKQRRLWQHLQDSQYNS